MGSSQSIPSTSEITDAPTNVKEYSASTNNGQKTKTMVTTMISVTTESKESYDVVDSNASVVTTESDYSSDSDEESDSDSDEEENGKYSS